MEWRVLVINFPCQHLLRQHGDVLIPTYKLLLTFHGCLSCLGNGCSHWHPCSIKYHQPTEMPEKKCKLLHWPLNVLPQDIGTALKSAQSSPPVTVSTLWNAIHHSPAIWVHLQPTRPRQEGLSVCQSLSNDTRPVWPPIVTNKAQAACSRVEQSKIK